MDNEDSGDLVHDLVVDTLVGRGYPRTEVEKRLERDGGVYYPPFGELIDLIEGDLFGDTPA